VAGQSEAAELELTHAQTGELAQSPVQSVLPLSDQHPGNFRFGQGIVIQNVTFDLAGTETPLPSDAVAPPEQPLVGPADTKSNPRDYTSLGSRLSAAQWEALGIFAYTTATQAYWTKGTRSFHFKDEGWFGKDTKNLGIDKLTHAFNTYLFSEFLGARIGRKTGNRARAAVPGALLASGLAFYGELWDAHKKDSGFSAQDVIFNTGGAAFSVLRHTIPGLEEKLDFRLLMMPNSRIYSFKGKRHYEQQRFLLSLELAGFKTFQDSPVRFIELQAGYRGQNFTNAERAAGIIPKRDIFFGVALNVKELLLKNNRSRLARAVGSGLNYFQMPYTGVYDY
jgi:uncharacterized protein YfiM (DUF2279 family)